MKSIVYLHITSFIGVSFGAQHYYGKLICRGNTNGEQCLTHVLTEDEAAALRKAHDWSHYRAGYKAEGYDSEAAICQQAIAEYKTIFPDAVVLVEGNPVYSGPHKILAGPDGLAEEVRSLIQRADEIGWWEHDRNRKQMNAITAEYDEMIKKALA